MRVNISGHGAVQVPGGDDAVLLPAPHERVRDLHRPRPPHRAWHITYIISIRCSHHVLCASAPVVVACASRRHCRGAQCVVRTYLKWLEASDFDPTCPLCHAPLDNGAPTIRLVCHGAPCRHCPCASFPADVLHWACLRTHADAQPRHTAPAGFLCPSCQVRACPPRAPSLRAQGPVVPPAHAASPVAEAARALLRTVPWSGLPSATTTTPTAVQAQVCPCAAMASSCAAGGARGTGGD